MAEFISADKFIETLQELHKKMDVGFSDVYSKMNTEFANLSNKIDFMTSSAQQRQIGCLDKFTKIETKLKVKAGINGVKAELVREKKDYWKYFIRVCILLLTTGTLLTLWKLFISNIKIISN